MKLITTLDRLILTGLLTAATISISPFAHAQLPPIVDSNAQTGLTVKDGSNNSPNSDSNSNANSNSNSNADNNSNSNANNNSNNNSNNAPDEVITASAPKLKVTCQDLTTLVQKGDRQAVMVSWSYDGFGKEFGPEKRCQAVSERLQQVADLNGGTFRDLQLASGTVNSQPVICALQSNSKKCNAKNILFTLKPENARNPDAVIQKIFTFAQDGTSSLNESASSTRAQKADMNLGNWEQKMFPQSKKSTPVKRKTTDRGF
jgi:hypothetical protein